MNYHVTLVESEEGFAVWCDDLPGCNSQGATREEAFSIAKAAGENDFADSIRARIALYKKGSPFRLPE